MAVKMKDLLDRFASMQKAAEETLAAEPGALVGVKEMPGSEHDAQVPASAKKPDAEVTHGQPAGATTAEGAVNGGDAKPLNEGKLEVNQPLENPEQKPAITDDALTAKEAGAHLKDLVGGLLADIAAGKAQAQKQAAAAKPAEKTAQDANGAQAAQPAQTSEPAKTEEKNDGEKTATAKTDAPKIELNEQMLSKLAEAVATYNAGRKAAEDAIKTAAAKPAEKPAEKPVEKPAEKPVEKTAAEKKAEAIKNIKEACIKAAQAAGLDQAAAEASAAQAMTDAGVSAEDAQAAQAAAAGAEGAAAAGEGAAAAEGVQLPEDVTEEELAKAIIDCVQSGELDVESAKAIVDEIAGDAGGADAGITEDQAAEAIAAGLESGEITPEQAEGLIAAIEGGAGEAAGAAGAAGAEAQGAEAAAQAAQEASDEAKGAADAEAAIKQAAAAIRANAIQKIASAVNANREAVKQAAAKEPKASPLTMKVASILKAHKEAQDAKAKEGAEKAAAAKSEAEAKYLEGFCKKAAELGVDPQKLAQYIVASKAAQAK